MPPSFSAGLHFTLGREELPSIINVLRTQEKVDLVVLISHLGFPQDMKLVLSLTFDHRVLDGAPAARFLIEVAQFIEQPQRIWYV